MSAPLGRDGYPPPPLAQGTRASVSARLPWAPSPHLRHKDFPKPRPVPFPTQALLASSWGRRPRKGVPCPQLQEVGLSRELERSSPEGGSSHTQRQRSALTALPHGTKLRVPSGQGSSEGTRKGLPCTLGIVGTLGRLLPTLGGPGWLGWAKRSPSWPYLWELAPGDLRRPVALDHDGRICPSCAIGAGRLVEHIVVGLMAGVQAPLPDLLVEPGVWGEAGCHLPTWGL